MPASKKAKYQRTAEEQRQNLSTSVGTPKVIRHHLKLISQSATGKNKVPYKSIKDNMYQVELKNLPNGVKLRDPSCMGLPALKEIISARDSLEFSITSTNSVATRTSSDESCRLNQDQVEIPNAIQDSLEDEGNQTASVTIPDHNDVPNVMQESLEDDGKQKAFLPNPVEAKLLMHLTDSKDTNSVLEDMESSTSDWFEVVKMLKTKKKEKANSISLSGRDMRSQSGNQKIILEDQQNCKKRINIYSIYVLHHFPSVLISFHIIRPGIIFTKNIQRQLYYLPICLLYRYQLVLFQTNFRYNTEMIGLYQCRA